MIFASLGHRERFTSQFREAGRFKSMMFADRSKFSRQAILFFSILFGLPVALSAATLEDSAKELARKAAAELRSGEIVALEISNRSNLQPEEVARIQQAFTAELHDRGANPAGSTGVSAKVSITLSESFSGLVWTAEIHQDDASHAVLVAVPRTRESPAGANAMHITIRSEKFWEGPERILDATEASSGDGKSRVVLLLSDRLMIQDTQTGATDELSIPPGGFPSRDLRGRFDAAQFGNIISFFIPPRMCGADLEKRSIECLYVAQGLLEYVGICGATDEVLVTGAGDYTQTDSVQAFRTDPSSPISAQLEFPGPIMALHSWPDAHRIILRNLKTGNYEAHRVSITCEQ